MKKLTEFVRVWQIELVCFPRMKVKHTTALDCGLCGLESEFQILAKESVR